MQSRSLWSYLCLVAADLGVLIGAWPHPHNLIPRLAAPHAWVHDVGADAAAATLAGAGLWLAAAWLAVGLAAGALCALPGVIGQCAHSVTRFVLPDMLYRLVAAATGAGLVLSPVSAMATGSQPTIPSPAWPTSAAESQQAQPADPGEPDLITVRPGDSLWGIAAARLGSGASAGVITASWRHIYAGNRRLIGPDPGLIRPGQRLHIDDDSAVIPR